MLQRVRGERPSPFTGWEWVLRCFLGMFYLSLVGPGSHPQMAQISTDVFIGSTHLLNLRNLRTAPDARLSGRTDGLGRYGFQIDSHPIRRPFSELSCPASLNLSPAESSEQLGNGSEFSATVRFGRWFVCLLFLGAWLRAFWRGWRSASRSSGSRSGWNGRWRSSTGMGGGCALWRLSEGLGLAR